MNNIIRVSLLLILTVGIILVVILLLRQILPVIQPKSTGSSIDLTNMAVAKDLARPHTGSFVAVDSAWCDQNNLANLLGTLYMDQLGFRAAPNNWNKTFYGETDWQYSIQGKITSLNTSDKNHITITVVKDNSSFTGNFTDTIPEFFYDPLAKPSGKLFDSNSLKKGDLVIIFLAVKCGGNRPPAVAVQAIEKINQFVQ